mmetsp:Transcript_946/g.2060  ORF Transcript_946/g.2060 Transcript_946/m.2060 type:complete len:203 (+) Transcript_946:26-634(+)
MVQRHTIGLAIIAAAAVAATPSGSTPSVQAESPLHGIPFLAFLALHNDGLEGREHRIRGGAAALRLLLQLWRIRGIWRWRGAGCSRCRCLQCSHHLHGFEVLHAGHLAPRHHPGCGAIHGLHACQLPCQWARQMACQLRRQLARQLLSRVGSAWLVGQGGGTCDGPDLSQVRGRPGLKHLLQSRDFSRVPLDALASRQGGHL